MTTYTGFLGTILFMVGASVNLAWLALILCLTGLYLLKL